uniref:Uncharacterized protein n=1 Tax=Pseudo-nitzschia delicatissima TaxID=44447 RepID=A0A7S0UI57_9STRA
MSLRDRSVVTAWHIWTSSTWTKVCESSEVSEERPLFFHEFLTCDHPHSLSYLEHEAINVSGCTRQDRIQPLLYIKRGTITTIAPTLTTYIHYASNQQPTETNNHSNTTSILHYTYYFTIRFTENQNYQLFYFKNTNTKLLSSGYYLQRFFGQTLTSLCTYIR